MQRLFYTPIAICFIILAGCLDSTQLDNEDVAAIVRGDEITIGDLRFLYPDDELPNVIDGTIKAKLVIQEAQKMNIDVSLKVQESMTALGKYPSKQIETEAANTLREFIEPQAEKFGLSPEEYYKKYNEISIEIMAYLNAYLEEILGEPKNLEKYDEKANKLLDDLVQSNEDVITIFLK